MASTTQAGCITAADKAKLEGIYNKRIKATFTSFNLSDEFQTLYSFTEDIIDGRLFTVIPTIYLNDPLVEPLTIKVCLQQYPGTFQNGTSTITFPAGTPSGFMYPAFVFYSPRSVSAEHRLAIQSLGSLAQTIQINSNATVIIQ